ncbi:MAG: alanine racemase [Lachnospiraceae bacterium]|nr:alanine racemase [Lachnospiraceae bacterium]
MKKHKRVFAAIHLDAVKNNIEQMEKMISDKTGMLCVIKTDGYGHGAVPVASVLESEDCVAGFAVATAEEAIELRDADINKPVLVLGYTFPQDYDELIYRNVRMTVFRRDTLKKLSEAVERLNSNGISCKALVHIKVDTGMGRIGIMPDDEGLAFVEEAMSCKGIEVEGIFTHFARADETDKTSAVEQYKKFIAFVNRAEKTCGKAIPYKHCANSAAILELPQTNMDLVRAGIAMYGLWPSDEVKKEIALQPVLSLHSHIVYCKEVPAGTPISYGGTYVTDKLTRVATVPVGYGDGYPRALSNIGHVLVCGKKAPILGRICMDQFMIDVSDIPEAVEGCLVTLIGRDGKEEITMEQLGDLSGRFNYELACDLGKRIPRVYYEGKEICSDF